MRNKYAYCALLFDLDKSMFVEGYNRVENGNLSVLQRQVRVRVAQAQFKHRSSMASLDVWSWEIFPPSATTGTGNDFRVLSSTGNPRACGSAEGDVMEKGNIEELKTRSWHTGSSESIHRYRYTK